MGHLVSARDGAECYILNSLELFPVCPPELMSKNRCAVVCDGMTYFLICGYKGLLDFTAC